MKGTISENLCLSQSYQQKKRIFLGEILVNGLDKYIVRRYVIDALWHFWQYEKITGFAGARSPAKERLVIKMYLLVCDVLYMRGQYGVRSSSTSISPKFDGHA